MSAKISFHKLDTTLYHDFKRIGKTVVVKSPALKGHPAVSLASAGELSLVVKCFDRRTFKSSANIDNFFKIIGGEHARAILTPKCLYYVSSYCNAGSLRPYVDAKSRFSKNQLISFVLQMACQLRELHAAGFYHGELTPDHIIINLDQDGKPEYRLCGFGHLLRKPREFYNDDSVKIYLDQRIVENPYGTYDSSCDLWSLGVIVYQLAAGALPDLSDRQCPGTLDDCLIPPAEHGISSALAHLVSRCVMLTPSARTRAATIPYHPFFIPTRDSFDPYVIDRELGSGRFCHVNLCHLKEHPAVKYAVKVLNPLDTLDQKSQMQILGEINVLMRLGSCPYAIHLQDYFELEGQVYLVLELCEGGDLEDYLTKQKTLTDKEVRDVCMLDEVKIIAYNMASALHFLHSRNLVNRDVKPKNALIVLDPHTKRLAEVKLSDFGTCKELVGQDSITETIVGTPRYISPEVYDGPYDHKIDVWSYGITLYYLAYGILPTEFGGRFEVMHRREVRYSPKPLYNLPESFVDLVKHCLVFDPAERYNMQQVLSHKYFSGEPYLTLPGVPPFYQVDPGSPLLDTLAYTVRRVVDKSSKAVLLMKMIKGDAVKVNRAQLAQNINQLILLRGSAQLFKLHQNFVVGENYYFILDYTSGQTLHDYVTKQANGKLDIEGIRTFGRSVAQAISHIHSRRFLHTRVSPLNVLMCPGEDSKSLPAAKLTGLCPYIQDVVENSAAVSLYLRPSSKPEDDDDIYKFGELMYFMVTGGMVGYGNPLQFPAETHLEEKEYALAKELIRKCAEKGYLTSSQILKDEFFVDGSGKSK